MWHCLIGPCQQMDPTITEIVTKWAPPKCHVAVYHLATSLVPCHMVLPHQHTSTKRSNSAAIRQHLMPSHHLIVATWQLVISPPHHLDYNSLTHGSMLLGQGSTWGPHCVPCGTHRMVHNQQRLTIITR
jgi:hypothetical protein